FAFCQFSFFHTCFIIRSKTRRCLFNENKPYLPRFLGRIPPGREKHLLPAFCRREAHPFGARGFCVAALAATRYEAVGFV
ncbi:MAG: hypothetical protein LBH93_01850, partial [Chitinispirillales bacterium]|nr:hypothetical protein [Chitinispirillales bacterium]